MNKEEPELEMYADSACTQRLESINWQGVTTQRIVLINGAEITRTYVDEGKTPFAEIWIKNPSQDDYGITAVSFSDPRVQIFVNSSWVYPQRPTKITLTLALKPNENVALKSGELRIEGYFLSKKVTV
jgi:hypothetical protein